MIGNEQKEQFTEALTDVLRSFLKDKAAKQTAAGTNKTMTYNELYDHVTTALPSTFFEMMLDFQCWPDRMKFGVLVVSTMDGHDKYETLFFVSESECQPFIDRSVRHLGKGMTAAYYVYSRGKQRPEFMRAEVV